jgi:mRNA interferase RelE/StbE
MHPVLATGSRENLAYALEFRPAAVRQLRKLDPRMARRLTMAAEALCATPRPRGVKPLAGRPGSLRIRVGDYRIVYEVLDKELTVVIIGVGHRRLVYGGCLPN